MLNYFRCSVKKLTFQVKINKNRVVLQAYSDL